MQACCAGFGSVDLMSRSRGVTSGGVQEKINSLLDPNGTLNWPMVDANNVIAEGHHTIVAMELAGYLDQGLITSIKEETTAMLKNDRTDPKNWIHGMKKTPASSVRILDANGAVVRFAK